MLARLDLVLLFLIVYEMTVKPTSATRLDLGGVAGAPSAGGARSTGATASRWRGRRRAQLA